MPKPLENRAVDSLAPAERTDPAQAVVLNSAATLRRVLMLAETPLRAGAEPVADSQFGFTSAAGAS